MIDGLANLDPLIIVGAVLAGCIALALWPGRAIAARVARRAPLPKARVAALLGFLFMLWFFLGVCLALYGGRAQTGVKLSLLLSATLLLGIPLIALVGYALARRFRAPRWCLAGAGFGLLLIALTVTASLIWNAGGWPPLAYAARNQHLGMVRALFALGMNPNRADRFQFRPLDYAASRDDNALALLLLEHGAEADANNGAALSIAVWSGRPHIVSLLLARGAKVEHRDARGWTSLMYALEMCNTPVIEVLLAGGAARSYHGEDRLAAVRAACARGEPAVITRLLHQEELRNRLLGSELAKELYYAAGEGDREAVADLIEAGADVNARQFASTPLIVAEQNGHLEMLDLLIERGADVNGCDKSKRTALMYAAMAGREAILGALLAHGAKVDALDSSGRTALMEACQSGRTQTARLLLNAGADTSLRDNNLADALTLACRANHTEIVQLLGGSCEKAVLDEGRSGSWGPSEMRREILRQRATGLENELFQAVSDGDIDHVTRVLASGWPINRKSEVVVGGTVLLWAAYCDRPEIVKLLIERGADLNLPSDQGVTPLIEASQMGHAEVVKVLLATGADANRQTGKGWTALMWSVEGGHFEVVHMLLDAKARIDLRNNRDETALAVATRLHRADLRTLLQSHGAR